MPKTAQRSPTEKQIAAVIKAALRWREKHQPSCEESTVQCDHINEALPDLACAIFNQLGWYRDEE